MKILKKTVQLKTHENQEFLEITDEVRKFLKESRIQEGLVTVYSPHTTAGIVINENADPDVLDDLILGLEKAFPDDPKFKHMEGNASSHLKAINVGNSISIPLEKGLLDMGIWQGIFFCDFDGPRERKFIIQIMGE